MYSFAVEKFCLPRYYQADRTIQQKQVENVREEKLYNSKGIEQPERPSHVLRYVVDRDEHLRNELRESIN